MRISTGIDIVDIDDFKRRISRTKSLKKRLFAADEISEEKSKSIEHLAGKFAAKEAFRKAVGLVNLSWHDVSVLNLPSGKPMIRLGSGIKLKIKSLDVSISHTKKIVVAVVYILQYETFKSRR